MNLTLLDCRLLLALAEGGTYRGADVVQVAGVIAMLRAEIRRLEDLERPAPAREATPPPAG